METFASPKFKRSYKKLPKRIKIKAEKQEKIFRNKAFDPCLHTHKLHGKEKEYWAYSVDKRYRIIFVFLNNNRVLYLDIGTHDEVY
jgi:addiction module RelE/StbE family toxin